MTSSGPLARARRALRRPCLRWRAAALAVVVLLVAAFAGTHKHDRRLTDTRSEPPVFSAGAAVVEIRDHAFSPGNLVVTLGTSVTWVNHDPVAHTATARDGTFDTGMLAPGESKTLSLEVPGVFEYSCLPHPFMLARVTVTAAGDAVSGPD